MAVSYDRLYKEGERNWVLHLNNMAYEAMRLGDRELAKRCLDESIQNINNVFGSTPEARRARSLFFSEDSKLFKGESHERAMAFFYRGILYMQDKEWDQARAAFRSGNFQDAFAEEEQNQSDWTIFDYLEAVCEVQMSRDGYAEESYKRAEKNHSEFVKAFATYYRRRISTELAPVERRHNLLVIAQNGIGPQKVRMGEYGEYVSYRPLGNPETPARITFCNGDPVLSLITDSVHYQANTRGGRPIDRIQGRKAFVKGATSDVGDVALLGGASTMLLARNSDTGMIGLGIIAVALTLKLVSALTVTKADIRQWGALPDTLSIAATDACEGETTVRVTNAAGRSTEATVTLPTPGTGLVVILSFPGRPPTLLLPPKP